MVLLLSEQQRRRKQMDNDRQHENKQQLLLQLNVVEAKLVDLKGRWPYHSVQAKMVAELEDLEEERERLRGLLNTSEQG